MKMWLQITLWSLGLSAWLVLINQSQQAYSESAVHNLKLSFENRPDRSFLSLAEMEKISRAHLIDSNLSVSEINKALLEESLDNHPAILKAEVYSKIDGSLRIKLWQHNPLARVIHTSGSFYLLEGGLKMPLSKHHSEAVPLISGTVEENDLQAIADFWSSTQEDEFFQDFFIGLECNSNKEWTLFPRQGSFKIRLGQATELKEKLAKLKVFYTNAPALEDIEQLKEMDLRFKGQLICRKN